MRGPWGVLAALAASACFHPSYDHTACGANEACPAGLTCRAQVCVLAADDAGAGDAVAGDGAAVRDAASSDGAIPGAACWRLDASSADVHLSACPSVVTERLDITSDVLIDTATGASTSPAISCALISDGPDNICALSAKLITIAAGVTLSARGTRPLALLAHDINVQGTIDVASHVGQPSGAGATTDGCNLSRFATQLGGGGGGSFNVGGGAGGDQGNTTNTGADGGGTITVPSLRGGCPGTGGGGGGATGDPHGAAGAGGGAVWLSVDTGTLTLGNTAVINASGAGGSGGATTSHGGSGGGSGGLIVLHAKTIVRSTSTSLIFADGGGGGGGAIADVPGQPGNDPTSPTGVGAGGTGGAGNQSAHSGNGGAGAPAAVLTGVDGDEAAGGGGGGGGGGGAGLIWIASDSIVGTNNIVPAPIVIGPS